MHGHIDRFVAEMARLQTGAADSSMPVSIRPVVRRDSGWGNPWLVAERIVEAVLAGLSALAGRRGAEQYLLLFDHHAEGGDRALLKLWVDRREDLSGVADGCEGTAYGRLEAGGAVAVDVGGERFFGSLPAETPSRWERRWLITRS